MSGYSISRWMNLWLTDFCDSNPASIVILFYHRPCVDPQHTPMDICDTYHVVHFVFYSCSLFLVCFFFLLPCFKLFGSVWDVTPMLRYLNILILDPSLGLVKNSLVISYVGYHSTNKYSLWILSFTKQYLMFICLVRFLLD